jgi:hypothetical protein
MRDSEMKHSFPDEDNGASWIGEISPPMITGVPHEKSK